MPRVSNVDSIAPDDPVTPPVPSKKKIKKIPVSPSPSSVSASTPSPAPSGSISEKIYDILGHTKHPLSSLLVNPHVFSFQEKDDDEKILLVARAHWITNLGWILVTFLMLFVPGFLKYVPLLSSFPPAYQFISILFWYLVTFAYSFEKFLSWYFNVYIVTTKRVVDIDFNNLLVKKYSDAEIHAIQDVTSAVIGAIPTIFNYGNVLIQTAAEINQIVFERVPNPEKIIKLLQELRDLEDPKKEVSG